MVAVREDMYAIALGSFEDSESEDLRFAAQRASVELHFVDSWTTLKEPSAVERLQLAVCVLVHNSECEDVTRWLREQPRFFALPVLALVRHASHSVYRQAYSFGVDDVLEQRDLGGLTRRLANLRERPLHARPPANQGMVLLALPDIPLRRMFGRTLRQAGFEVHYALNQTELLAATATSKPLMMATHDSLPPSGAQTALPALKDQLRASSFPALVLPVSEQAREAQHAPSDAELAGRLLFFAEEVLRGAGKDKRASARLLHHSLVSFREPGDFAPAYGLTHNISRQGMYVRTLDPPRAHVTVWIELRSPGPDAEPMHLRGTVMWRREPKHTGGTAPVGFGLRLEPTDCAQPDLAAYEAGYDHIVGRTLGGLGGA